MAKTIVFFNLADMDEHGLAKTSVDALRRKYQRYSYVYELFAGENRCYQVDLFGLLRKETTPKSGIAPIPFNLLSGHSASLPDIARERLAISILCGSADKIMLGIHGAYDDTDQGFAGLGWDRGQGVVGNVTQFAALISSFLLPHRTYKLALIVCFGARSENYRVNHDGALDETDIKSSFAYKFFKAMSATARITLTARTGSVSFDASTGRSLVQTEAAVNAEIDNAEIQNAALTERIVRNFEQLSRFMNNSPAGKKRFEAMAARMTAPGAVARNTPEDTIKSYLDIMARAIQLSGDSAGMARKYGKFVYTCTDGIATVCRKYEGGRKVMRVLYRGPL